MANIPEEQFIASIADRVGLPDSVPTPARLKAKIYSALVQQQAATGSLLSLSETRASGRQLCIFEEAVCIVPVGEAVKSLNFCRVCHARVLAEHIDDPPIYWSGCPYVDFKKA